MAPTNSPYQKEKLMDFDDIYHKFKNKQSEGIENKKIHEELQNIRTELKEIKEELAFIKNSLGDHFLVKGKWIHIDHFKPIFLGKDD
jgi:hypothetical protein